MALSAALLPEFDQEMANTRKTLERVPDDKFDWKPHTKSMTVRQLTTHLALFPSWMVDTLNKESFDYAPLEGEGYKPPAMNSRKDLLETFDRDVAAARKALEGASDAQLMATWSLLAGGKTIFAMPRIAVLQGYGAESHDPPPCPAWSLPAAQRSAGAGHLWSIGRRASVSKMLPLVPWPSCHAAARARCPWHVSSTSSAYRRR